MHFLDGNRLGLRPLMRADFNARYLGWLNDPDTSRYSQRRNYPTSEMDMEHYHTSLRPDEYVLAIVLKKESRHIGNIRFGPIDWLNLTCEIHILIGEKEAWGKGLGSEAMYMVTRHLFQNLNINRVEARSANPAFNHLVTKKLSWTQEGELRERFYCGGHFISIFWYSILKKDFKCIPEYECPTV